MKHVSPYITFCMGLFMVAAAVFYTLIICDIFPLAEMDRYTRLVFMLPSAMLTLCGTVAMIHACIKFNTLRFCRETGKWVCK